jgi:hypothetical protein
MLSLQATHKPVVLILIDPAILKASAVVLDLSTNKPCCSVKIPACCLLGIC